MSGERADSPSGNWDFQEGIMQGVGGFVPDSAYTIILHQAVVKSYGSFDTSGSWAVYVGNTLIGITEPTSSQVPYDSWPFVWEERSVSFTATSTYHQIKFLPVDDDLDLDVLAPNGSLRMGIDLVSILRGQHLTGLVDHGMEPDIAIWPNPFVDHLSIRTSHGYGNGQISLHTITGSLVFESSLGNAYPMVRVDLAALRSGLYWMSVDLDGQVFRQLVVKE
jgi:hypothetical protein